MGKVGSVIAGIEKPREHAPPWSCRRMPTWISPDTIGTVINPTASARKDVFEVTEMTKDENS